MRRPKPSPAPRFANSPPRLVVVVPGGGAALRSLVVTSRERLWCARRPACLPACLLAPHSRACGGGGGGGDGTVEDHGGDDLPWSATERTLVHIEHPKREDFPVRPSREDSRNRIAGRRAGTGRQVIREALCALVGLTLQKWPCIIFLLILMLLLDLDLRVFRHRPFTTTTYSPSSFSRLQTRWSFRRK